MIKNIVFDLGNVLISFRPSEFLDKFNYTEPLKTSILKDIFGSRYWLMLDNGDLTTEEAIERIASESSLKRAIIDEIFNRRIEILIPIHSNVKILPELKKQGFRLYYLSNFPDDLWKIIRNGYRKADYGFFRFFDGGMISAEAHSSKPDAQIYNQLLSKYSLKPEECLFLDDLEINVRAAESSGMNGIVTHGSHEIYAEIKTKLGL
ncbi:MAG TPA: HAD family phosphatase [Bacteroidales bacterium]|nr:HAD family phosphatase [Bacteroidales bacterium]